MKVKYVIYLSILFIVLFIMDVAASNSINVYLSPILVSFLIVFMSEKQNIYFVVTFATIFDTIFSTFVGFYLFIALLAMAISYIIKHLYSVNKFTLYIVICAISEFLLIVRISLHKGVVFAFISAIIATAAYPLFSKILKNIEVLNE